MKTAIVSTIALSLALLWTPGLAGAAEKAPQEVVELAQGELAKLGADPVIIAAVQVENTKGKTLDAIKKRDQEWQAHAGIADYMQALMDSPGAKHLRGYQAAHGYVAEMFLTDDQGANVAMTDKTSDYWQGDEAKFTKAFNGGQGQVFLSDVKFDDSTQVPGSGFGAGSRRGQDHRRAGHRCGRRQDLMCPGPLLGTKSQRSN